MLPSTLQLGMLPTSQGKGCCIFLTDLLEYVCQVVEEKFHTKKEKNSL